MVGTIFHESAEIQVKDQSFFPMFLSEDRFQQILYPLLVVYSLLEIKHKLGVLSSFERQLIVGEHFTRVQKFLLLSPNFL